MRKSSAKNFFLALALLWVGVAQNGSGQEPAQQPTGEKPKRAVVTLDGKLEDFPQLEPADFEVEAGKKKLAPTRLYDPDDLPTLLAIVLQDNLTQDFGAQLPALRDFILKQPANTYVGLFYLNGQSIDNPVNFDRDLQKVANALRAPRGTREAAPPSPYDKVAQIVVYMDRLPDARKEVLLFSEGSDAFNRDSPAPQNRSLVRAVDFSLQTGIPVWIIYTAALPPEIRLGAIEQDSVGELQGRGQGIDSPSKSQRPDSSTFGPGAESPFDPVGGQAPLSSGVRSGLTYLDYLAERTGGKVFSSGKFAVDMRPHLEQLHKLLGQQYVLEWPGPEPAKKVKLNRKLKDVKVLAPKR